MQTNRLLTEPVSKIFFRYLLPAIMANMVTSIYILADTIIIGKGIGADAMAALRFLALSESGCPYRSARL